MRWVRQSIGLSVSDVTLRMKRHPEWQGNTIMKQWAKREEQIERVMDTMTGMYGGL